MKRRWIKRLALVLAALLLVAGLGYGWLVGTTAGLRWLLGFAGPALSIDRVEGSLAAGFRLDGLSWKGSGASAHIVHLESDLALGALWRARVELSELNIEGLQVGPGTDAATPADAAPESTRLPALELPVDILVRRLRIVAAEWKGASEAADPAAEPLVLSLEAERVGVLDGRVVLDGLQLRRGEAAVTIGADVDTRNAWRGDLRGAGEWSVAEVVRRANVRLSGDEQQVEIAAGLDAAEEMSLRATFADPLRLGQVDAAFNASGLDLAALGLDAPVRRIDAAVDVRYADQALALDGQLKIDGIELKLDLAGLRWREGAIEVERLDADSPQLGALSASGRWPLQAEAAPGALQLALVGVALADPRQPIASDSPRISGDLKLSGHSQTPAVQGAIELAAAQARWPLQLDVALSETVIEVRQLIATLGQGQVQVSGQWPRETGGDWQFAGQVRALDPALYAPDWPGRIDAEFLASGTGIPPAGDWQLRLDGIGGTLRELNLGGQVELSATAAAPPQLKAGLDWGAARLDASSLANGDWQLDWSGLSLTQIDAGWQGRAQGSLRGPPLVDRWLEWQGQIEARELRVPGFAAGALRLAKRDAQLSLRGEVEQAELGGQLFATLRVDSEGSLAEHSLRLRAQHAHARIETILAGGLDQGNWRGAVEALDLLATTVAGRWQLADVAPLRYVDGRVSLEGLCLDSAEARACLSGERELDGALAVTLGVFGVPLAWVNPFLPEDGFFTFGGAFRGGGRVSMDSAGQLGGNLVVELNEGSLRIGDASTRPVPLSGRLQLDGAANAFIGQFGFADYGGIEADIRPLSGATPQLRAGLKFRELAWLDGASPEVLGIRGRLQGQMQGPLDAAGNLSGSLSAEALSMELPGMGLILREGQVEARAEDDGVWRLDASFAAGEGEIGLEGLIGPPGSALLDVRLRGRSAQLVALPAVSLVGSPELKFARDGEAYRLSGSVHLERGRIDLDRFAPTVASSADVVIEDAPPAPPPAPLAAELAIRIDEAVELRGFGLRGTLSGDLAVRQRAGRKPRGTGEIQVEGTYRAYGQRLAIERGNLTFSNSLLENPALDIQAVRKIDQQRVGVLVRGNARRPLLTLYSDPALDQSEALAYLVLGRPIYTANAKDSQQLGEAASALQTAGGGLIGGAIGARLGLDAGVESFGSVIGSAFVVGKYLSPRFYLGYGSSLLDATQLVILRYRLTDRFEAEAIAGREQKAGINYREER